MLPEVPRWHLAQRKVKALLRVSLLNPWVVERKIGLPSYLGESSGLLRRDL